MRVLFKLGLLSAAGATVLGAASAWAAEGPLSDGTATQDIIVTAQKREQRLIDVPITLSAYTGEQLQRLGVQDLHDLSLHTPGFYVQNQSVNDPGIVMRGVTTDSTDPTDEPRVSIYQDGVSISQIPAAAVELFDLERVEVAKGPQTTLYGRSALTGAVNIIENKASEKDFDWSLHAEGGNFNYGLIEGMVNVPLSDTFAVRVAAIDKERDGYIDNVAGGDALNGVSTKAARISANFHPNAQWNDDLIVNYQYDDPSGTDFKNKTFSPSNPVTGQVLGNTSPFTSAALNGSPLLENGAAPNVRRTVQSITNILTYRISDAFKLTSTSAVRHFYGSELFDPDGFSFPVLTAESSGHGSELSQDVRLNYDPGGRFSAFAGLSAFGDNGQQTNALVFDEPLALGLVTGVLNRANTSAGPEAAYTNPALLAAELQGVLGASGLSLPASEALGIANNLSAAHYEQSTVQSHTEAYDAYVDGTYRPFDKLEISGGIRYSDENKTSKISSMVAARSILGGVIGVTQLAEAAKLNPASTGNCNVPQVVAANQLCQLLAGLAQPGAAGLTGALPLFGLQGQPTAGNGQKDGSSLSDEGLSWRLTARYIVSPTVDVYATYARGRRPEVLSALAPSTPFGPGRFTVAPSETLDSYEGGMKSRFFQGRLSLDGAFYYYSYEHFQTTVLQGTQFVTADAGNAETYGFEGQANWAVTPMADLFATYAFTHGRFTNGILDGNQFRLTPENAVTVGGSYRIAGLGGVFDIRPSYRWQSKVFFNDDNGNPTIQKEEGPLIAPLQFDQFQNSYGLLDLRVGYAPGNANWRIEAFATNLTDTHYLKDGGNTGTDIGLPTYIPGEPRFYGLSFTIRR
jgi:iron complex outermembrane receptor protein